MSRPGADGTGAAGGETTPHASRDSRSVRSGSAERGGLVNALARAVGVRPLATNFWAWRGMDRPGREWATRQFLGEVADALWGKPCADCGGHHDDPDGGCLL